MYQGARAVACCRIMSWDNGQLSQDVNNWAFCPQSSGFGFQNRTKLSIKLLGKALINASYALSLESVIDVRRKTTMDVEPPQLIMD